MSITYSNKAGKTPELYIYDQIGPDRWGLVSGKSVATALAEIGPAKELIVHLNSPGGDVFEGITIYNLLNNLKNTKVIMQVDGLAASAASLVLLAGDEVQMAANAFVMIHNVWTIEMGDKNTMRKTADRLEQFDTQLVATYAAATGLDPAELQQMMDAETWLSAEQAKEKGFADSVMAATDIKACVRDGLYRNTPKQFVLSDETTTPEPISTTIVPTEETTPEPKVEEVLACPKRAYAILRAQLEQALAG